jgi:NADP-reducing hydrogenase subunit HndB
LELKLKEQPIVKSLDELRRVREEALRKRAATALNAQTQVVVSLGTPGIAVGALEMMRAMLEFIEQAGITAVLVRQTGSLGLDSWEPIVQVRVPGGPAGVEPATVTYGKVTPQAACRILQEHVVDGQVVGEYVIPGT